MKTAGDIVPRQLRGRRSQEFQLVSGPQSPLIFPTCQQNPGSRRPSKRETNDLTLNKIPDLIQELFRHCQLKLNCIDLGDSGNKMSGGRRRPRELARDYHNCLGRTRSLDENIDTLKRPGNPLPV